MSHGVDRIRRIKNKIYLLFSMIRKKSFKDVNLRVIAMNRQKDFLEFTK